MVGGSTGVLHKLCSCKPQATGPSASHQRTCCAMQRASGTMESGKGGQLGLVSQHLRWCVGAAAAASAAVPLCGPKLALPLPRACPRPTQPRHRFGARYSDIRAGRGAGAPELTGGGLQPGLRRAAGCPLITLSRFGWPERSPAAPPAPRPVQPLKASGLRRRSCSPALR